jgi:dTDP-4-dehydrorhamnose 3,5-epimerase
MTIKTQNSIRSASSGQELKTQRLIEGVIIKKLIRHQDERGFFEEVIRVTDDFFKEGFGQWSYSTMHQGVIKAWHIHKTQTDWWYVGEGTLIAALYDLRKGSSSYRKLNQFKLGQKGEDIVLKIPYGVAHGCKVLSKEAKLFYITSKVYNPNEEGRIPHDDSEIGFDWSAL